MSDSLDDIIDAQEDMVLGALKTDRVKSLVSLGATANMESAVPMTELAVSTAVLVTAMEEIYRKAVADNIIEGYGDPVTQAVVAAAISEHLATVNEANSTTQKQIAEALLGASSTKDKDGNDLHITRKMLIAYFLVKAVFNKMRSTRKPLMVDAAVLGPYNQGLYDAAQAKNASGVSIGKEWVSLRDERVRVPHKQLHGDNIPVGSAFYVSGTPIRFPKDPLAPAALTINCRCILKFTR